MCSPIAFGGAQAAASALGSIGKFQADQKQTSLINQGRLDQYNQQLLARDLKYSTDLTAYKARISDYKQRVDEGYRAYGLALEDNQARLNDQYRAANVLSTDQTLQANAAAAKAAARGTAGQSANLQYQSIMASLGRNQSLTMDNLLRARYSNIRGNERLRDTLTSNLRQSYNQIGASPLPGIAPPKPVFSQGPSSLGLVTDIGSSLVSGFGTAYDMADKSNGLNLLKFKND